MKEKLNFSIRMTRDERYELQKLADLDSRSPGAMVKLLIKQAAQERLPRPEQSGGHTAVRGEYAR